jgi:hypothetical protein
MSSVATFGSATDDPVHPAREPSAPHSNNVHAEEKTEKREREHFVHPTVTMYVRRKTGKWKIVHTGNNLLVAILWFLKLAGPYFYPSHEYQAGGARPLP